MRERKEAFPGYPELLGGMCEKQGRQQARTAVASPLGVVGVVRGRKKQERE